MYASSDLKLLFSCAMLLEIIYNCDAKYLNINNYFKMLPNLKYLN